MEYVVGVTRWSITSAGHQNLFFSALICMMVDLLLTNNYCVCCRVLSIDGIRKSVSGTLWSLPVLSYVCFVSFPLSDRFCKMNLYWGTKQMCGETYINNVDWTAEYKAFIFCDRNTFSSRHKGPLSTVLYTSWNASEIPASSFSWIRDAYFLRRKLK